jgi:hypothetical protein
MRGSAEQSSLLWREFTLILFGVNELVTLLGRQVAHAIDGAIDSLPAVGWQLLEALK